MAMVLVMFVTLRLNGVGQILLTTAYGLVEFRLDRKRLLAF